MDIAELSEARKQELMCIIITKVQEYLYSEIPSHQWSDTDYTYFLCEHAGIKPSEIRALAREGIIPKRLENWESLKERTEREKKEYEAWVLSRPFVAAIPEISYEKRDFQPKKPGILSRPPVFNRDTFLSKFKAIFAGKGNVALDADKLRIYAPDKEYLNISYESIENKFLEVWKAGDPDPYQGALEWIIDTRNEYIGPIPMVRKTW